MKVGIMMGPRWDRCEGQGELVVLLYFLFDAKEGSSEALQLTAIALPVPYKIHLSFKITSIALPCLPPIQTSPAYPPG